ncbi:MAG TPA: FkbM family methyltransferase [Gemmataceae bacterium]|nr:FkbM family methyltransferase [Gemmataceae bacterium]
MVENPVLDSRTTLASRTKLLRSLWYAFPRLRRLLSLCTGRAWGHWDGEAWRAVGPRLFGGRTALALDAEGHTLRIRLAQWVDLTSLIGRPEEAVVERIVKDVPVGGTVIDAGAHIGRYTLMAASAVGPSGRVIAIEPGPDTFTLLRENAALNQMTWITPIQAALGKEDGWADLFTGSDQATNSLRGEWLDKLEGFESITRRSCQKVTVRSLPSLLAELGLGSVDLLKIDVEGAELEVLQGARALLRSGQIKQIICEVHQPTVRPAEIRTLLRSCGFAVNDLGNSELQGVWRSSPSNGKPRGLRLAIVGCGAITQMAHLPAIEHVDEVRLIGLVDTDGAQAQALAAEHGVPRVATRLEDLAGDVDAVVLATPPHVRCALAQFALERGLHVLCEKPIANSVAECQQMIATAQAARRTLAVAHTYRFFANRCHARTLFQAGALGRFVEARIEQGSPFSWPTRTAYTLRRECVPGGVLFNEGLHTLDLLFWWFGPPRRFEYADDSLGGLESNVQLLLEYERDATVHFRLSRTCSLSNRVEMRFEKATVAFPMYNTSELELTENGGQPQRVVLGKEPFEFVAAVAAQLRDFALAATEGSPSNIPAEAGLAVLELIEACYRDKARHPRPKETPLPGLTW